MKQKFEDLSKGYHGTFTIELNDEGRLRMETDGPPYMPGVTVKENIISVDAGSIETGGGSLNIGVGGKPFWFGYTLVNRVVTDKGEVIWKNWNFKK